MNPVQFILVSLVRIYRWTVSPLQLFLFGPQGGCRFTPSCSQYAAEAVRVHGAMNGSWLAAKRICRCHPWGDCGHDPVPLKVSGMGFRVLSQPDSSRLNTPTAKLEIS